MFNQVEYVESLLKHGIYNKSFVFQATHYIARYFLDKGMNDLEVKEEVKKWESKFGYKNIANINKLIEYSKKFPRLRGAFRIEINKEEVELIKHYFDSDKTQLVALIFLCMYKIHGGNRFELSNNELADYMKTDRDNLRKRNIKEIISMGYLDVSQSSNGFGWSDNAYYKNNNYIVVPFCSDSGEYIVDSNDINVLKNILSIKQKSKDREIWMFVPNQEHDIYQVSTKGKIRQVARKVRDKDIYVKIEPKNIETDINEFGKLISTRTICGTNEVDKLVAMTFLENQEGHEHIRHKNGFKTDCCVDNIEWCKDSESIKTITSNYQNLPLKCKSLYLSRWMDFADINECNRIMHIPVGGIIACCNDEIKSYKGYVFQWL